MDSCLRMLESPFLGAQYSLTSTMHVIVALSPICTVVLFEGLFLILLTSPFTRGNNLSILVTPHAKSCHVLI